MQSPDPDFDHQLDAQLRDVPLPEGLRGRLRRVALADDAGLDEALRAVALPAGWAERVRSSILGSDDDLDELVHDVPVPAGLTEQLRQIPAQLQRVPGRRLRLAPLAQWVTAASLMVAIALSYFSAMLAMLTVIYPIDEVSPPLVSWKPQVEISQAAEGQEPEFGSLAIISAGAAAEDRAFDGPPVPVPEVVLYQQQRPSRSAIAELGELFSAKARRDLFLDAAAFRDWGVLTAHTLYDDQPELEKVAGLIRRGVDMPLVPGANKPFLIRFGVHPFVSPASHPGLCSSVAPLAVDAASYELTRRYLRDNELPPAEAIRTEDFLAAVDYGFARPRRAALGLSTAAGPSPFGGQELSLLQIGVQAKDLTSQEHAPSHLVLAVDVSASMRWGGRLEMIRRALRSVVRQLGPEDRLSLVVFSDNAQVLLEDAGPQQTEQLLSAIDLLASRRGTSVAAGLRQAYALAEHGIALRTGTTRVVLLSDGLAELDRASSELIEQRLAEAARLGIRLEVLDLGQEMQADRQLAGFARAGAGAMHRAINADEIRWKLVEIISGRSLLVAAGARLKVTFNPKAVLAYRLLGHEAKAMAGLMPANTEADFHAGQSGSVLYELRLNPGAAKEVAAVELSWRPPDGSSTQRRTVIRKVRRGRFGSSFVQAPPSLQEAALVAQTAEVIRRSPFARTPRGARRLAAVLELAEVVDTGLHQRPNFVEFLSLVEQADGAKPYRSGSKR